MAGTYLATTSSTRYQSSSVPSKRKVLLTQTTKSYINASLSSLLTASSPTAYSDYPCTADAQSQANPTCAMGTHDYRSHTSRASRTPQVLDFHSNADKYHSTVLLHELNAPSLPLFAISNRTPHDSTKGFLKYVSLKRASTSPQRNSRTLHVLKSTKMISIPYYSPSSNAESD
jgi:hypothetical protein